MERAQVVIIGGGVIGLSVAYSLSKRGCRDIVVLEKEKFLGACSTGACAGGIRQQFSTEINILLGIASVCMYEEFERELDCKIDFRQNGYLFLLSSENGWQSFQKNVILQKRSGLSNVRLMSPKEVKEFIPLLNIDDLCGATFCPTDALADPNSVVQGYAKEARRLGVKIYTERAVTGIKVINNKIDEVETTQGNISSNIVINAAGAYASLIGDMVGVSIPVSPVRRQIFVTTPFKDIPVSMPMVVDFETSLYMHPESGGLLMGMSDHNEPPSYNTNVDQEFMMKVIEQAIHRMPVLERSEIMRGWGGLYEVTPDYHPIIGAVSDITGLYCAAGFSGHGFMHAPVTGKLMAQLILDGKTFIDISSLSLTRFQEGRITRELNVI